MSIDTYSSIKTYIDNNVNTNGIGAITGAIANTALVSYLLKNASSLSYDATKPYHSSQVCVRVSGNVKGVYIANQDMTAGAFNSTKWDLIIAVETVTYSVTAAGSQTITHNLGVAPKIIIAEQSSGADLEKNVTAKSTTDITIYSIVAYADAQFHLITW